ncbi:MAG: hypothetical protein JWP75_345 [Frondihabitans sp.]|nr:hypothetical protein [Frondihabitans sp.]
MRRDKLLPAAQHDAVISALYDAADEADWNDLTPQEHSRFYRRWIEDPAIGGILTRFMTPEGARSWIKDGPMKEYANASRGTGRYARFGREGGTDASDVAQAALGAGATVIEGTQQSKPHRCLVTGATEQRNFVVWGTGGNFRNLLWAALRAEVIDRLPAHIVILEPPAQPTTSADMRTQRALTDRCQLSLHYLPEVLGKVRRRGSEPVTDTAQAQEGGPGHA